MTLLVVVVVGLVVGVVTERLFLPGDGLARSGAATSGRPIGGVERLELDRRSRRPRLRRRRKSLVRRLLFSSLGLLLLLMLGGYLWANSIFNKIDRVEVSSELSPASGTNYLLVGADNNLDGSEQREGVDGVRADTIMVLRIANGKAQMLSLNRDLWVTNPATGQQGRLNATYNQGPANLVRAVTTNLGIPIERYIEIDFGSFSGLVDSFGGIEVEFANPAFDLASGLDVKQAGTVHLDGAQALAYVRSRHFTEVVDGANRPEGGLPDINRTMRQQTFLRQIMSKTASSKNPVKLLQAASKMAGGLRIDDDMSMIDAARFAFDMTRHAPETVQLPVVPRRTSGGAEVLELGDGASGILAGFR